MKWALILYFFYTGAYGGWKETDRHYYPDHLSCIEAQKAYEADNPYPDRVKVRCELTKKMIKHSYNLQHFTFK